MTPTPEKAAPIPAGQAEFDVLWPALRDRVGRGEIVALAKKLAADRASQEERIAALEAEIEEMTPKFVAYEYLVSPAGEEIALAENARLRDRIAALEAGASEGERRGLERAAQMAEVIASQMRAVQEEWRTPKNDLVAHLTHNAFKYKADLAQDIAAKVRALIPEAPAREGE